jgi:hypothetical protein
LYRAYCYISLQIDGKTSRTVRLTSEPVETEEKATVILGALVDLPGVSGGDLETQVPGVGWVLGGTDEAQSVAYRHHTSGNACAE